MLFKNTIRAFMQGWKDGDPSCISCIAKVKQDRAVRDNLTDKQLDRMLKDTFPSSDAVAMY